VRWYILWIMLWLLQGCGNPTSFKSNVTIGQLETANLDKNITVAKDEDNTTQNLVKALKSIKEEWGEKYVESVESKDKRHLFVIVYDGFYILYDYDLEFSSRIV